MRGVHLSDDALEICGAGLSGSTHSQYSKHLLNFKNYCLEIGESNYLSVNVSTGIEFLTSMFKKGLSFSTLNSARSALSQYVILKDSPSINFGKHPLTVRFMRGAFKLRPSKPRYTATWDASLVLGKLRTINNLKCAMKDLTLKCVMLIALATGQRAQTISLLALETLVTSEDRYVFHIADVIKTSRPGYTHSVEVRKFDHDIDICPLTCLQVYIKRTEAVRGAYSRIFLSLVNPIKPVSSQTISRWLMTTLRLCNINSLFKAHSTRSASASKAALHIDVNSVLKTVGWCSERTFAVFYNKPTESQSFVAAVFS